MRDIEFRGKRIDNGQWVNGSLATEYYNECGCVMISPNEDECYKVEPNTVCEYTGLQDDKTGKKIFEGDIVRIYFYGSPLKYKVVFAENVAQFRLVQIGAHPNTPSAINLGSYSCELIGNIYDNPELLKEVTENERM